VSYWPRRPALSEPEIGIEAHKASIRRSFRACIKSLDRTESLYHRDRLHDSLIQAREFARESVRLARLVQGMSPADSAARTDAADLSSVPAGKLRDDLVKLLQELRTAEDATSEGHRNDAIKAFIVAAVSVVRGVKTLFKEKLRGELRTPIDIYKRQLVVAIGKAVALIVIPAGLVYGLYEMSRPRITVLEATFGANCDGVYSPQRTGPHSIERGNATQRVSDACNNSHAGCRVSITAGLFGDPAPMCGKEFSITWRCSGDPVPHGATIAAEATGKSVSLTCGSAPRITVREATYGASCDGKPAPGGGTYPAAKGNRTAVFARLCNLAENSCSITVGMERMPDPAPLCGKDFEIVWDCSGDGRERRQRIAAEALGKAILLACDDQRSSR
jgi:hypothetical protein